MHIDLFLFNFSSVFFLGKTYFLSGRKSLESKIHILSQEESDFITIHLTVINMRSSICVANLLDISETASLFSPSFLCYQTFGSKTDNTLWWQTQQLPHRPAGTRSRPESGTGTRWGHGRRAAGAGLLCAAWQIQSRRSLGPRVS